MIMTSIRFFQAALLLLAVGETSGFVPRTMPGRITFHTTPPLYTMLDKDTQPKVSNSNTFLSGWKNHLSQILDVNGDGKVDHKDATSIAALACISWSLMAAPAMAQGSNSSGHSSSHASSHASSSRSSSSRSSSRSSSSISSSSSRSKSSPYHSVTTSSSPASRPSPSSSSSSKSGGSSTISSSSSSSPTPSVSSVSKPNSASRSSSSSTKSLSAGDRVTMSSPKSSSARLKVTTTNKSRTVGETASGSTTKMSGKISNSQSSSSSSSPTVPSSSKTSAKPKTSPSTVTPASSSSPMTSSTSTPSKKKPSTTEKSTSISLPKPNSSSKENSSKTVTPTKPALKTVESKPLSSNSPKSTANASSDSKVRKRSGNRVGGRASKQSSTRESVPTRNPVIIERNTYIVEPSPRYYGGGGTMYSGYPPSNSGIAPLEQPTKYPPYRRLNTPTNCNRASKCDCDLPYESEAIDVLVDPVQGFYVRGSVTFVDTKKCDFTVTIVSSADGKQVQKSFHAIPLEQYATGQLPRR